MPHGKVCYLEIPAITAETSADYYRGILGWTIRKRGDGELASLMTLVVSADLGEGE